MRLAQHSYLKYCCILTQCCHKYWNLCSHKFYFLFWGLHPIWNSFCVCFSDIYIYIYIKFLKLPPPWYSKSNKVLIIAVGFQQASSWQTIEQAITQYSHWYLLYIPSWVLHKAIFKVVWVQGCCSDMPDSSKNASGFISLSLKWGTSVARW